MEQIKCPECGHNEAVVAVWGTVHVRSTLEDSIFMNQHTANLNIDEKDENTKCARCNAVAHYKDFVAKSKRKLTIEILGDEITDLEVALNDIRNKVGNEYLAGSDENDTGKYTFNIEDE